MEVNKPKVIKGKDAIKLWKQLKENESKLISKEKFNEINERYNKIIENAKKVTVVS